MWGCPHGQCVPGAVIFVTALRRSVSLPCANHCLTHQPKPPLCKGRWQKSSIFAGGVVADQSYHYAGIYANSKLFPHNPSVKNQRFLTAPFTQGSLGRSRASASRNDLQKVTIPSSSNGVTIIASHRNELPVGASPQTTIYRFAASCRPAFSSKPIKREAILRILKP